MEFLRRQWATIRQQAQGLSANTRLLIGSLLVILLLVMALLTLYASRQERVPITAFASDSDRAVVVTRLEAAGIDVKADGRAITVPADQYVDALQTMMQSEMLAGDTAAAFDELIANQSPWISQQQNATNLIIAKQKMLSAVIRKWAGVRSADVMISMPEDKSFGRTYVRPSASVNVVMRPGQSINRKMVEAFAGMVSGAVAEMQPEDVVVIDANQGRQYTVKQGDEQMADEAHLRVQQLEDYYHGKISALVESFIPNAFVAVNVQVNPVLFRDISTTEYDRNQLIASDQSKNSDTTSDSQAAEPGARSNTMADIQSAGGTRSRSTTEETVTTFGSKPVTQQAHVREVGQNATQINVTINVPDSYFRGVFLTSRSDPSLRADAIKDEELAPVIAQELAKIEEMVRPLIQTRDGDGIVKATRIMDASRLAQVLNMEPQRAGLADTLAEGAWVQPTMLGGLAVAAVGIMLYMVRNASRRPPIPTVEELAGVPPTLDPDEELVGEASETEAEMGGMEVNEEEIRQRKLTEQISELIKSNPDEAARLVGRWVQTDEY